MNRPDPWIIDAVEDDVRDIAERAARDAGISAESWIDRIIRSATGLEDGPDGISGVDRPSGDPNRAAEDETARQGQSADEALQEAQTEPTADRTPSSAFSTNVEPDRSRLTDDTSNRRTLAPRIAVFILALALLGAGGYWLSQELPDQFGLGKKEQAVSLAPQKREPITATQTDAPKNALPGESQKDRPAIIALRRAATDGDATAQNDLGTAYMLGRHVPKSARIAAQWFERSAAQGFAKAQHNLGVLFERGEGVDQNDQLAQFWYQAAAEQGHAAAQHNLGRVFADGRGRPVNYTLAASWFSRAARTGLAASQFAYGRLLEEGLGVEKNIADAVSWYRKAAGQGNKNAHDRLRALSDVTTGHPAKKPVRKTVQENAQISRQKAISSPPPPARWQIRRGPEQPVGMDILLPLAPKELAEIQQLLRQLNIAPDRTDGTSSARTRAAIREYQSFAGLTPDGVASLALLQELREVAGTGKKVKNGTR